MPDPQTLFTVVAPHASGRPAHAHGLARGCLFQAGADDVAHQYFVDVILINTGVSERSLDGVRAEFRGGERGQAALKTSDRCAGRADNVGAVTV